MTATWALIRASWLSASSYRVNMVMSMAGMVLSVIPLYFVANALQPMMSDVIRAEGHQYFGFLILGTLAFSFIPVAVRTLPTTVSAGISNGTLEAVLSSPTSMPAALTGLMGYNFLWTLARGLLTVVAGALLGAAITWERGPAALLILVLIVLAYVPFGVVAAASVLVFRTPGPIPAGIMVVSSLLGGVYYPTHVIPSWLEAVSGFVPLTYGLRALRRVLLDGNSLAAVSGDLGVLLVMDVALLAASWYLFSKALRYARRSGTLGQY